MNNPPKIRQKDFSKEVQSLINKNVNILDAIMTIKENYMIRDKDIQKLLNSELVEILEDNMKELKRIK